MSTVDVKESNEAEFKSTEVVSKPAIPVAEAAKPTDKKVSMEDLHAFDENGITVYLTKDNLTKKIEQRKASKSDTKALTELQNKLALAEAMRNKDIELATQLARAEERALLEVEKSKSSVYYKMAVVDRATSILLSNGCLDSMAHHAVKAALDNIEVTFNDTTAMVNDVKLEDYLKEWLTKEPGFVGIKSQVANKGLKDRPATTTAPAISVRDRYNRGIAKLPGLLKK